MPNRTTREFAGSTAGCDGPAQSRGQGAGAADVFHLRVSRLGQQATGTAETPAIDSIADESVYALCDLVCGSIARQFERTAQERAVFVKPSQVRARAR